MKKIINYTLFLFALISCKYVSAQPFISNETVSILKLSIQFNIVQKTYVPNQSSYFDTHALAMATLQERYDRGFNYVRHELHKVLNLKLLNEENRNYLQSFIEARMSYWKSYSNVNLANSSEVKNCIDNIIDIYKLRPSIINEIELLKSCNNELTRIKYKDPDNYIYSKRYKAIAIVIKQLENCPHDNIKNLSWEKTELEMR